MRRKRSVFMNFRPAAVPLMTADPYFSVWSTSDELYSDITRHWSEKPCPILMGVYVGEEFFSMAAYDSDFVPMSNKVRQTSLKVTPLSTTYTFENELFSAEIVFTTPLIPTRLDLLSRTVSYVKYDITKKCDEDMKFVFGIGARIVVLDKTKTVKFGRTEASLYAYNPKGEPLSVSGDLVTADWGSIHIIDKEAFACEVLEGKANTANIHALDESGEYNAYIDMPYVTVKKSEMSGVVTVAYDGVYACEYFGKKLPEYYTSEFSSFIDMALDSKARYDEIKALSDKFDARLIADATPLGEDYVNLVSIAYRQTVSGHKIARDDRGNLLFLSKECESNGCIGTLDITYPSMPLFLKYNPELVVGMLRPIVEYAESEAWPYEFTPHDVGQYPIANGQVYGISETGEQQLEFQMPIEESGNMLLSLAAVKYYSKETPALFTEHKAIMKKWADYLVEFGYDPGEQLCTDDFAGHLNHNCNLSVKAILGIAAYSLLSEDSSYLEIARELAKRWEKDAPAPHGATGLTFDLDEGWSLKYNIVWDSLLGFGIFSDNIKKKEVDFYKTKINEYGVPLDSRKDYTKLDWLVWSTAIYPDKEYFALVMRSIARMINETPDRVPLTDWYFTSTARHKEFQARTVVGGVYISLL